MNFCIRVRIPILSWRIATKHWMLANSGSLPKLLQIHLLLLDFDYHSCELELKLKLELEFRYSTLGIPISTSRLQIGSFLSHSLSILFVSNQST